MKSAKFLYYHQFVHHHQQRESPGSRTGDYYTTADGGVVVNEGEKTLTLATCDGGMRQMTFQLAAVNKALGSVSQIVSNGNRVVFEPSGSFIQNLSTGERLWLRETNGVYVLDVLVGPPDGAPNGDRATTGFPGPDM